MKNIYETPVAQIVDLRAMEEIALNSNDEEIPGGKSQGTGDMGDF